MTLVVVCGVPGVGKTSVSEHLVGRLDATWLRTDVVRKELFAEPQYTDAESVRVYEALLSRAEDRLASGETVVVDGTFHDADQRAAAHAAAERAGADCQFVKVECDREVAEDRIREREGDASDATVATHRQFREQFDPLDVEHVTVDNSGSLAATREKVDDLVVQAVAGVEN